MFIQLKKEEHETIHNSSKMSFNNPSASKTTLTLRTSFFSVHFVKCLLLCEQESKNFLRLSADFHRVVPTSRKAPKLSASPVISTCTDTHGGFQHSLIHLALLLLGQIIHLGLMNVGLNPPPTTRN